MRDTLRALPSNGLSQTQRPIHSPMVNSNDVDRPITSKARGICKYYDVSRGCFAGDKCKFLHGQTERLTQYDKAKTCRYFAAGFCKHGDKCWFIHEMPEADVESADVCAICLEKPATYALLSCCSHTFCIEVWFFHSCSLRCLIQFPYTV